VLHSVEFVPGKLSFLRACLFCFTLILVATLLSTAARAQVTYTGTTANQNFGSQAIGSTSAAQTFSFSVAAGTTVGSIGVVTQGASNLDFTNATGTTCTATTYASATTCTVEVTFAPRFAGLREGGVVFFSESDNTGTVLGEVLIYGTGTGPQLTFAPSPATATSLVANGQGLFIPRWVSIDGAGDVFVAGYFQVMEIPAGGGAPVIVNFDNEVYAYPGGLAVDGAGDLFIAANPCLCIVEVPVGGGASTSITPTISLAVNDTQSIAIDRLGNLFIADTGNDRVVEVPAGGGAEIAITPTVNGSGLGGPEGLATDAAGNLFIADYSNSRVIEVPAGGGAATAVAVDGNPIGVAVDGVGDLFVSHTAQPVTELPAGGGTPIVIAPTVNGSALSDPYGLAVDGAGNLVIVDSGNGRVVEVQRSQPAAVTFPTPTEAGSTDTTDLTRTVQVRNDGNEALMLTALSYPADFPEAGGDTNACAPTTSLSAGQECDLPIEFAPENFGPLSENVSLTDNTLNVPGTEASIAVSGMSLSPTAAELFSITTSAPVTAGKPFSITVTAINSLGKTASTFNGTVSLTSSDPGFVNPGPVTVTNGVGQAMATLNTPGTQTITATDTVPYPLTGTWSFLVIAVPEMITSPTPGSTLTSSSVTFVWTVGTGAAASGFGLQVGTGGPGSSNLYNSFNTSATSATVTVPTYGKTLYVTLFYETGYYEYSSIDYTYTEATSTPAALTSPFPGSTVGANDVEFTWSAGTNETGYVFCLGYNGPGSSDIYASGDTTALSATIPVLPTRGQTLYARLYSYGTGSNQYTDYIFTEGTSAPAALTSPTPGSALGATNIHFTWTAGAFENQYQLWLGYAGPGSSDLYNSGLTTALSATVPSLPTNGATVYARLFSKNGNNWSYNDYTYTEGASVAAVLTSPTPGSTLGAANINFTWTAGTNENQYQLWLGLTGPGSSDLFASGLITALSATVPSLPAHGSTVYARLFSKTGNNWSHNDYTFTEP
jgi:hypothetical protein